MGVVYGIKIREFDDPYIAAVEESVIAVNAAAVPGSFLVDLIPALKYVPNWFPGAGFKKKAAYWAELNRKVVELPFNHAAEHMASTSYFSPPYFRFSRVINTTIERNRHTVKYCCNTYCCSSQRGSETIDERNSVCSGCNRCCLFGYAWNTFAFSMTKH